MTDENPSLDDKIEIEGVGVCTVGEFCDALVEGIRAGVRKGLKPLHEIGYVFERSTTLKRYVIASLNATRYGITSKPMGVSEIVPFELLIEHNVTNGRGYAPRSHHCEEGRLMEKEPDTTESLQAELQDMDEHDRRIGAVCQHISDIVSEKCSYRGKD